MKWILRVVLLLVIGALIAAVMQHFRYLDTRRDVVMDTQDVFHSNDVFHVVTVLKLGPDQELLASVRRYVDAVEAQGASVVYAGKISVNALKSKQIPPDDWDAFVLAQYPTRAAYEEAADDTEFQSLRAGFQNSYALGMQRSAPLNLGLPIMLLGMRTLDVLTFQPSGYPFKRAEFAERFQTPEQRRRSAFVAALLADREYGKDALVVLNFTKAGSADQQAANSGYGSAMMSLMAEKGYGPMHIGSAVTLEGGADFDQVVIVYYPGSQYFADMVQSEFFTSIVGGKQLGDSLASPSVPLLPHL